LVLSSCGLRVKRVGCCSSCSTCFVIIIKLLKIKGAFVIWINKKGNIGNKKYWTKKNFRFIQNAVLFFHFATIWLVHQLNTTIHFLFQFQFQGITNSLPFSHSFFPLLLLSRENWIFHFPLCFRYWFTVYEVFGF
jgi:hypothetical protein